MSSRPWKRSHLAIGIVLLASLAAGYTAAGGTAASSCLGKKATIVKGGGNDTIVGTKAPDVIDAGGGNDVIHGLGGNDRICGGAGKDRILAGKGVDRVSGGGGDDFIIGDRGADKLAGDGGDDYIDGQKGSDLLKGGGGNDRLLGDKGNDTMLGGGGKDELDGGLGDEKLIDGGKGDGDVVIGNLGTDKLSGGPGDGDVVRGDAGIDTLDGGGGKHDIASFATASQPGVIVNIAAGTAKGDGKDTLKRISDVVGSAFDDTITGSKGVNLIDGGPGNDDLNGMAPSGEGDGDQGFGGPGADACQDFGSTSSCNDRIPPQQVTSVELNDGLDGKSLVITGIGHDSNISVSFGGAFIVSDTAGVETRAGTGCAIVDSQTARCEATPGALNFILIDAGNGNDTITIAGNVPGSLPVRANGGNGNDNINGGAGDDILESGDEYSGTSGNDTLNGNEGSDGLVSDPGGDVMNGGPGNDLMVSSAALCQGHTFDGGPGIDTASWARSKPAGGMVMTLGGTAGPSGCRALDRVLSSNESLEGSDGDDVLNGDDGNNHLMGHLGADVFNGSGGSDLIDALDGERDKAIDCGPGDDQGASVDSVDPPARSC
ncbi:MAG: calcium-binding protein [Solirubrobacterales bacterium]